MNAFLFQKEGIEEQKGAAKARLKPSKANIKS
jgi:hypothetical protein